MDLFRCSNYVRAATAATTKIRIGERELYRSVQPVADAQVRRILRENGQHDLEEQQLEIRQARLRLETRTTFVFERAVQQPSFTCHYHLYSSSLGNHCLVSTRSRRLECPQLQTPCHHRSAAVAAAAEG